jgi:hypothetical protein
MRSMSMRTVVMLFLDFSGSNDNNAAANGGASVSIFFAVHPQYGLSGFAGLRRRDRCDYRT